MILYSMILYSMILCQLEKFTRIADQIITLIFWFLKPVPDTPRPMNTQPSQINTQPSQINTQPSQTSSTQHHQLRARSQGITDYVVTPDVSVYSLVAELALNEKNAGMGKKRIIVLDTQGNVFYEMGMERISKNKVAKSAPKTKTDMKIGLKDQSTKVCSEKYPPYMAKKEIVRESVLSRSAVINGIETWCYRVASFHTLMGYLEELERENDFILLINSITFVFDRLLIALERTVNQLERLLEKSNVRVITINHYKLSKSRERYSLVPRLGKLWQICVAKQVLLKSASSSSYKSAKLEI